MERKSPRLLQLLSTLSTISSCIRREYPYSVHSGDFYGVGHRRSIQSETSCKGRCGWRTFVFPFVIEAYYAATVASTLIEAWCIRHMYSVINVLRGRRDGPNDATLQSPSLSNRKTKGPDERWRVGYYVSVLSNQWLRARATLPHTHFVPAKTTHIFGFLILTHKIAVTCHVPSSVI
jgi:hypothetical protein